MSKRLLVTTGEPAGIGPDLIIDLATKPQSASLVALGCPRLLTQRAAQLDVDIELSIINEADLEHLSPAPIGTLYVLPIETMEPVEAGQLNPANGAYVIIQLNTAVRLCLSGVMDGVVTLPVQKSTINDSGIPFTGHTEFLAERTATEQVVMMLATSQLRVALVTTHLPLKDVPEAITPARFENVCRILHRDLNKRFGISTPRVLVAGLNPHAGESGHLGREEIDTLIPIIEQLNKEGLNFIGPLPADTLFTPKYLDNADCCLAMYHDQGLPVLKYQGFGEAANITLGLPFIRTSVDHGTALDLAGTGKANSGSLKTAIDVALSMHA